MKNAQITVEGLKKGTTDKLNLKYPSPAPVGYLSDMMSGTCNGERPEPAAESKRLFGGVGQGAGAGQRMAGFLM